MTENEQETTRGLSKPERTLLIRSTVFGVIASIVTLWIGDVFKAEGLSLLNIRVIFACLLSILITVVISIMDESVIEDAVKLVMFSPLLWISNKYPQMELIALGPLIGGIAGFLHNRLFGK